MNKKKLILFMIITILLAVVLICLVPRYTSIDLALNAVKLDTDGNEVGTVLIRIQGCKLDYLLRADRLELSIFPFDDLTSIELSESDGITGAIQSREGVDYLVCPLGGMYTPSNESFFGDLGFSPDLDRWVFCNHTGGDGAYYVASASGNDSTEDLVAYFEGLVDLSTAASLSVPDSRIDWTMYGYMVSPGEEPISTTDLSVSGTVTYGETGTDVLELDIAFPQTARYRYDGPTAYYSQSRDIWGLGYFVCASYSYDSSANASVFSCFAVSLDKEYVIFNWEDGQDLYLVASTDPETDPHDILAYFQIFREKYAVDD